MSDRPRSLGPYTVEQELGRGGMGIVYLARDPRLNRAVAIKVLPDAFTHDPERLARFEREARLLASLNHPNIGAIFGLEQDGPRRFLVLQYVPGDTLAQRTGRGALALDDALDVCRQIAAALEAAHESGVIHRDMKPGNVKITPEGEVKVLDFGLAKGAESGGSAPDMTQSPTIAFSATGAGVILGTAAYMSPEQARGKPVDRRTDIWSFGCVLYECLTGRQIFAGETVSDMIAKILERAPDLSALPPQTPPRVRDLIERCLEKDAKKRLRDIGDARIELEAAIAARSSTSRAVADRPAAAPQPDRSPRTLAIAAGLVVLGAALGIGAWTLARPDRSGGTAAQGSLRTSVVAPSEIRVDNGDLSPDGRTIVFAGVPRTTSGGETAPRKLYVRPLDSFDVRPLPGTEGVEAYYFSPDGKWIVFRARVSEESSLRRLAKVAMDGRSPVVALADWDPSWRQGFVWMPNGDILLTSGNGRNLVRVPAAGGAPSPEQKVDAGGGTGRLIIGAALPGGRAVFAQMESWGATGYQNDTWLLDPRSGKARELIPNAGNAVYSSTGHVLFSRSEALFAAPFDLGRLAVTGEAVPLMSGLRTGISWGHAYFVLAADHLLYVPGGITGTRRQLMMVGTAGDTIPFSTSRRGFELPPAASRDGQRVAVIVPNAKGTYELWIAERDRQGLRPGVAIPNADCQNPVWAPDGERLAFLRQGRSDEDGIYVARIGSGEPPRRILPNASANVTYSPQSWSPDGASLLISRHERGRSDIMLLAMTSDTARTPRPLRATPADEGRARFSPDGRMIAFTSDESGNYQVYVARFGPDGSLGPPVMISTARGTVVGPPRWSGDGRSVLYATDGNRVMSAAIDAGGAPGAAAPVEVHNLLELRVNLDEWTTLPDGRLLVIRKGDEEDEILGFNLVAHWTDELRALTARGRGGNTGR